MIFEHGSKIEKLYDVSISGDDCKLGVLAVTGDSFGCIFLRSHLFLVVGFQFPWLVFWGWWIFYCKRF